MLFVNPLDVVKNEGGIARLNVKCIQRHIGIVYKLSFISLKKLLIEVIPVSSNKRRLSISRNKSITMITKGFCDFLQTFAFLHLKKKLN